MSTPSESSRTTNSWQLSGSWTVGEQHIVPDRTGARIRIRFHARDVHVVMGPTNSQSGWVRYRALIDGEPPGSAHGLDLEENGYGIATDKRVHHLVRQPGAVVDRTLEIEFLDLGIEAYAFTFG